MAPATVMARASMRTSNTPADSTQHEDRRGRHQHDRQDHADADRDGGAPDVGAPEERLVERGRQHPPAGQAADQSEGEGEREDDRSVHQAPSRAGSSGSGAAMPDSPDALDRPMSASTMT